MRARGRAPADRPNILVIIVDQMRDLNLPPALSDLDDLLPNLARLRSESVVFRQHYGASSACTPARACLLTGLYAHQTCCLLTQIAMEPDLNPGFPTWGTLLRAKGYRTAWFGKWHLSRNCDLTPYGFEGGTCPAPDYLGSMGVTVDPEIVDQFHTWLDDADERPWCATVSLVNPHDIVGFYRFTNAYLPDIKPPRRFSTLPANFETPAQLLAQAKPGLQRALQLFAAAAFGPLAFEGEGFELGWLRMLDLYMELQARVDAQIGRVLDRLADSPFADNTLVLFTADHGEYAGSHGLRGKCASVYDEGIRVPLYIRDPTGQFAAQPEVEREQLCSSVDILPLLLTIATDGDEWRDDPAFIHLASRADLAAILRDPAAPGRPYVVHSCDENFIEEMAVVWYTDNTPAHVIGLRTADAKLGVYSHWVPGTIQLSGQGRAVELYDYRTPEGRLETQNVAAAQPALYQALLDTLITQALPRELRQPLPLALQGAQRAALASYLEMMKKRVYLPQL